MQSETNATSMIIKYQQEEVASFTSTQIVNFEYLDQLARSSRTDGEIIVFLGKLLSNAHIPKIPIELVRVILTHDIESIKKFIDPIPDEKQDETIKLLLLVTRFLKADELTNYFTSYPYQDYFNELVAIDNLPQQAYFIRNNSISDRVVRQYMYQLIDKLKLLPGQKRKYPKMTPVEFMKEMRTIKCISPKMKKLLSNWRICVRKNTIKILRMGVAVDQCLPVYSS